MWRGNHTDKIRTIARRQSLPRRKVAWRARVIMAERGVRSVSELARRLEEIGVSISISQLGRMIDGKTQLWNQDVIEGMMTVLDCELSDIIR